MVPTINIEPIDGEPCNHSWVERTRYWEHENYRGVFVTKACLSVGDVLRGYMWVVGDRIGYSPSIDEAKEMAESISEINAIHKELLRK